MGAAPSRTRKLTIENDDPTSVIKVSDDVVERLKGKQGVRRGNPEIAVPAAAAGAVPVGVVPQPYLYEPSLTSIQLRQTNVAELKKNDAYWESRLQQLEGKHKKLYEIMELEYNKAKEELQTPKIEESPSKYFPPCYDNKKAVVDCYKRFPNEPMRCAKEVEAFAKCVDAKRSNIMDSRA